MRVRGSSSLRASVHGALTPVGASAPVCSSEWAGAFTCIYPVSVLPCERHLHGRQDAMSTTAIATAWEYRTAVQTGGFMGRKSEELDRPKFTQVLTQHGESGWELAWILIDQNLHREKDGHVLIFKRPMEQA